MSFYTFKRFLFAAVILILGFGAVNTAKACHLAAADIFIEYAGKPIDICNPEPDYTYRVTLVTYSSCNCGLTTGATERLYFESVNGSTGVMDSTLRSDGIDTVDQLCPAFSAISQCRVSANDHLPGYKRRLYTANITLPSGQTDWKFWWSSSARNPSTNLLGTGSLYVEAGMDVITPTAANNTPYANNTPRFESNPLPYICVGQVFDYLNLPFDPDVWDSNKVVVTNAVPRTGANAFVAYQPGYSANSPIPGYSLNSNTGTATFTPNITGQYTVAFRADDANSYVYRDVQFAVLPCTAPPPISNTLPQNLSGATLLGIKREGTDFIDSVVYVCPGGEFSFEINGQMDQANRTDTIKHLLYMRSDISRFPGSSFTTAGGGTENVTGTFKWTPTVNEYGRRTLVITTVDSTCVNDQPVVLRTNTVVQIEVVTGIDAGPDEVICEVNPQPVQLFVKGTNNLNVAWTSADGGPVRGFKTLDIHNPLIQYPFVVSVGDTIFKPKTETYIVSTPDLAGACKSRDTVVVELDTSVLVTITPKNPNDEKDALVMCRPNYLQLEALMKGRPPLDNLPCGTESDFECNNPETIDIFGSPLFGALSYDTLDNNNTVPVMYVHTRTSKKQYMIRKDEFRQWGFNSSTISGLAFEMEGFNPTIPSHEYNLTISMKCTDRDALSKSEGFENFGFTTVYSEETTLQNGWNELAFDGNYKPYNWDTTKNLIIQICYNYTTPLPCDPNLPVPVMKYSPTSYTSALMYNPGEPFARVESCDMGKNDSIVAKNERPVLRLSYCERPIPFDIKWTEGEFLSDSSVAQPLAYVPKSERYIVEIIGRSTCIMRDTLEVYVPDYEYEVEPNDTTLCLGDAAPFFITGGGHYFKWYEYNDGQYELPNSVREPNKGNTFIAPQNTTEYRIVVSDSVWCYDTIAAKINILPLPDVRILNEDDTVVKYGQQFQLLASGAKFFNWSPVSSLNNPNISYPIARPTEDTKYIVGGIGSNGCRAFDTLHVNVDKKDNLFVPTAFSPNGDGKNDFFKIANLSFQRVMEFRVFNRWGQEVYSGSGQSAAWDGRFENKEQPIGTYSYLIRVAYPDGFVETYKGETTLIK